MSIIKNLANIFVIIKVAFRLENFLVKCFRLQSLEGFKINGKENPQKALQLYNKKLFQIWEPKVTWVWEGKILKFSVFIILMHYTFLRFTWVNFKVFLTFYFLAFYNTSRKKFLPRSRRRLHLKISCEWEPNKVLVAFSICNCCDPTGEYRRLSEDFHERVKHVRNHS